MSRPVPTCPGCDGPDYVPHDSAACCREKIATLQLHLARLREALTAIRDDTDTEIRREKGPIPHGLYRAYRVAFSALARLDALLGVKG